MRNLAMEFSFRRLPARRLMVVIGIFVPTAMRRLRVIMVNERFKSWNE
jgi:hypothetical protein